MKDKSFNEPVFCIPNIPNKAKFVILSWKTRFYKWNEISKSYSKVNKNGMIIYWLILIKQTRNFFFFLTSNIFVLEWTVFCLIISKEIGVFHISRRHRIECDAPNGNTYVVFGTVAIFYLTTRINHLEYMYNYPKWPNISSVFVNLNFVTYIVVQLTENERVKRYHGKTNAIRLTNIECGW